MIRRLDQKKAIAVVAVAVFTWVAIIAPTNGTTAAAHERVLVCQNQIKAAGDTIAHAKDDAVLQTGLIRELSKLSNQRNETELVRDAWFEVSRVAIVNRVVLESITHDTMKQVAPPSKSKGDRSGTNQPPSPITCLDAPATAPSANVPATRQEPSPQPSPMLSVLPMTIELDGAYKSIIHAIADLSSSRVLMQYSTSKWTVKADGTVDAVVTVFLYPPVHVDEAGHATQEFDTMPNLEASPSPEPSAGS